MSRQHCTDYPLRTFTEYLLGRGYTNASNVASCLRRGFRAMGTATPSEAALIEYMGLAASQPAQRYNFPRAWKLWRQFAGSR
ncbi:hypothetical protein, partial [Bradyrhizobium sp.]|uniref:hypothetical protein n=1 Tax=Bradyrhizobium sp. TaxID=376 RepID=UPI003C72C0A7